MSYIPLHVHTDYSLGDSVLGVEEYVNWAVENEIKSIAITDHGSLCGSLIFNQLCRKNEILPIIGLEAYCQKKVDFDEKSTKREHLILLAKSERGYKTILDLSGKAIRYSFYYRPIILYEDLLKNHEDLIISSACGSGRVGQSILDEREDDAVNFINGMKDYFDDDFYLEVMETEIEEQRKVNEWIFENSKRLGVKVIWTTDSHYLREGFWEVHNALLMINRKFTYQDRDWKDKVYKSKNLHLKTREDIINELKKLKEEKIYEYDLSIVNECLDNTLEIDEKIRKTKGYDYNLTVTETIMPSWGSNSFEELKKESFDELEKKGLDKNKIYVDRLNMELDVIKEKNMDDYFLIVADIVKYAENNGIMSGVGRGCFCPKNEVRLSDSIKNIEDVDISDRIISGYGNNKKVLDKYEYDIDEDVCNIKLKNGDAINGSTLDHEFLVIPLGKKKNIKNVILKEAKDLKNGDCLIKNYVSEK